MHQPINALQVTKKGNDKTCDRTQVEPTNLPIIYQPIINQSANEHTIINDTDSR